MFINRLFWQFFLSIMAVVLLTAGLSVQFERFVRQQQSPQQVDININKLLDFRETLVPLLIREDFDALVDIMVENSEYYQQFFVFDEYENEFFERTYRNIPKFKEHFDYTLNQEFKNRGLTLTTWITSDWGNVFYIQIHPRMHFQPLFSPRVAGTIIRTLLLLLFSGVVCYLLTRQLTRRIRHLQQAVRQLSAGQYEQASQPQVSFANDELGQLGKDFQQMAERLAQSQQARKRMLTDISHELRSPLARMQVALAIVRERYPAATPLMLRAEKEVLRMNQLIAQIIKVQKQEIAQTEKKSPIEINNLLKNLLEDVRYEYQQTGKTINLHFSAEKILVRAEEKQLHSAFENVLRNAMSHTAANSNVDVAVKRQQGQGIITVKDKGDGVAKQNLEKIFQPFVRLDNSRNRRTGGYGLGLSIAKAIIESYQGSIWAENRVPKGLTIIVKLPCVNL